jgi:hypothetical protein
MKTAMQELLEEVTEEIEGSISVEFVAALGFVKSAIEQDYLGKEKWQIMNAYDIGWLDCKNSGGKEINDQYYFETYNTNEE